ncbi:MAG TPA: tectonin domain-containing protein [Blastocatellia bacterium]|nr:tectonin domain-containing protein [Blastocatellia bacterium]
MQTTCGQDGRRKARTFLAPVLQLTLLVLMAQSAVAQSAATQPAPWVTMGGKASDIGANANGQIWIIGEYPPGNIYRFVGGTWEQIPGGAKRIAVDPAGNAWVVNGGGDIFRYRGTGWEQVPGRALDIGIGANGAVWIIGNDQSILRGVVSGNLVSWQKIDGEAIRIAVDPQGNPWVVTSGAAIFRRSGDAWTQMPGSAKDIAIDAAGTVYVVGASPATGGFTVYRWQGSSWSPEDVAGENIAAGAAGVVYLTKDASAGNAIMARTPLQLTIPTLTLKLPGSGNPSGGLVVTGLGPNFAEGQLLTGVLLCPKIGPGPKLEKGCQPLFGTDPTLESRTSGPATFRGPAKADACPPGFRDDGDYCAKPPSYGRSAGYVSMSLCEASYGQGNCEQSGLLFYPKCATNFNAFGCCVCSPKCPDGWEDIGVSCKKPNTIGNCAAYGRVAGLGYAFHDPRNGGECWSCPVLMHRTFSPVDTKDPKLPACTAGNDEGIIWQSAQYPEPGVSAFINPAIVQLAFNDVAYVDAFLKKRAGGDAARKQQLWDQMINTPNESPEFKALIFSTILLVAQKDPNYQTRPSDAVSIFEDYIRKRRTYVAKDALAMYNAYLGFNAYKQNEGTKAVIKAGGPLGFMSKATGAIIVSPQASLSATIGVPPDDYVNAAYSAAVPDSRGEEFMRALADLGGTPYQNPSMGTASFDPTAAIILGLNAIGSATAIHDLLEANNLIKGVAPLTGRTGIGIGLGMGLGGSALDAVAAIMTVYAQQEAAKQYSQLVALADKPVSIAQILKSGSDEDKNSLIMWWALATSPYKPGNTVKGSPIRDADVCATYPSQCADIKRIVAAVRPTSQQEQPVTMAPAPPEFLEQVNAMAALAQLLSSANSTAAANAVKPGVADAVRRLNQATLAVKNLTGGARDAADQHTSELETASVQLRKELTRVRGVPGVYPILQSTLAQLDPTLRPAMAPQ